MTAVELEDGRKFGTQVVPGGTAIKVDSGTLVRPEETGAAGGDTLASSDNPFSLGARVPDGFFDQVETVEQQKARQAREAATQQSKAQREEMLRRQAAPIKGRSVDTTGDMFDAGKSDAPLFAAPTKKPAAPKAPEQGSLFSTKPAAPPRSVTVEQAESFIARIFGGKMPPRVVVSPEARTSGGRVVEGAFDVGTQQVILYTPNLTGEADIRRVLRHELLHDVYKDAKVAESWRFLRNQLTGADTERVRGEGYTANVDEEAAVDQVISAGKVTGDLGGSLTTKEVTAEIIARL
jgi:hypothetical protein